MSGDFKMDIVVSDSILKESELKEEIIPKRSSKKVVIKEQDKADEASSESDEQYLKVRKQKKKKGYPKTIRSSMGNPVVDFDGNEMEKLAYEYQ